MKPRQHIFIAASLLVFAVFNGAVYQKEQIIHHGDTVLLALAPLDPRSLMQGDYMRLRYELENEAGTAFKNRDIPRRAYVVVKLDENRVGRFERLYQGGTLQDNEKLFRYHKRYSDIRIVPDSFLFQEGHAKYYEKARYGEFKSAGEKGHLLTNLVDKQFKRIDAPTEKVGSETTE